MRHHRHFNPTAWRDLEDLLKKGLLVSAAPEAAPLNTNLAIPGWEWAPPTSG